MISLEETIIKINERPYIFIFLVYMIVIGISRINWLSIFIISANLFTNRTRYRQTAFIL